MYNKISYCSITLSCIVIFALATSHLKAQGLEKIIVEKYYIATENDTKIEQVGRLAKGSVTYRIYVDMLPGYTFQAAFGVEGHELSLNTTTYFFNNFLYGNSIANQVPKRNLDENTVMLDSWLSVGGASEGNLGILKSEDNGYETVVNTENPKMLQNKSRKMGIPLYEQDGLFAGNPKLATGFGIDSIIGMFGKVDTVMKGQSFKTSNGSWACLGGVEGPTASNRVLIAQMTTDGVFSFELNIQIGTPGGGFEQYVARNPVGDEKLFKGLIYSSSRKGK